MVGCSFVVPVVFQNCFFKSPSFSNHKKLAGIRALGNWDGGNVINKDKEHKKNNDGEELKFKYNK